MEDCREVRGGSSTAARLERVAAADIQPVTQHRPHIVIGGAGKDSTHDLCCDRAAAAALNKDPADGQPSQTTPLTEHTCEHKHLSCPNDGHRGGITRMAEKPHPDSLHGLCTGTAGRPAHRPGRLRGRRDHFHCRRQSRRNLRRCDRRHSRWRNGRGRRRSDRRNR